MPASRLPLRALDKMYGLVLECFAPGAGPKCLNTFRHLVGPRKNNVWRPVGATRASWSNVKQRPPAFKMRARADRVKRRAATVNFGTLNRRTSSVTVATVTTIFFSRSASGMAELFSRRAIVFKVTGWRWVPVVIRRRKIIWLNFSPPFALRAKNRYNWIAWIVKSEDDVWWSWRLIVGGERSQERCRNRMMIESMKFRKKKYIKKQTVRKKINVIDLFWKSRVDCSCNHVMKIK